MLDSSAFGLIFQLKSPSNVEKIIFTISLMLIDTHAHLMFPEFKDDIDDVIKRANDAGVKKMINVGCDLKSCGQTLEMLQKYECLYSTLGMHPYEAAHVTQELMDSWQKLIKENKKIVAIGECGLDYFKANVPKDVQKAAFKMQLELAKKVNLSVIVHNRDADDDCLEILRDYPTLKVVFHCYGSSLEFARKLWEVGIFTSFTGIVTYPKAQTIRDVVLEVPLDRFMVETDCPYLSPQLYRGKRNESSFVTEVVHEISRVKNLSYKEVERISTENAVAFFSLPR